jgi:hypothetical protein
MEPLFYYPAFAMLTVNIISESLMLVASVFPLVKIRFGDRTEGGANAFVLLQLLQAAVVVPISIGLLVLLRSGAVAAWIMFYVVLLFSIFEIAARRYRLYKAGQAEWFW